MSRIFIVLTLAALLVVSVSGNARAEGSATAKPAALKEAAKSPQETPATSAPSPENAAQASELGKLSETLKDPAERKKLIADIDALAAAKAGEMGPPAPSAEPAAPPALSEAIGLDQGTRTAFEKYRAFLENAKPGDTVTGQLAASGLAAAGAVLLFLAVRIGTRRLGRQVGKLRRRHGIEGKRFDFYTRLVRIAGYIMVAAVFAYSLATIWEVANFGFLQSDLALKIFSGVLNLLLIALLWIVSWEIVNALIEHRLRRADENGAARVKTLLPLLRTILFLLFAGIFLLLILSELGINIVPFMAGAGVLGIAVGFGAQTMVKDFISGFTIILEDLMQVGDVVRIAGHSGSVEKITIRKVQLRDVSGIVYTIPFSEIRTIENLTKDFSFYLLDVGVCYGEDTDRVTQILREVDEDLRADPVLGPDILEPLEILGLDRFADSAVILRARIKTKPSRQWPVGREFNRRMKRAFDAGGVEMPFPHRTVYVRAQDGKNPQDSASEAAAVVAAAGS